MKTESLDRLVRMANAIGDYFDTIPDPNEAASGVADHIRRFWEPRMRQAIFRYIDESAGSDLHPLVKSCLLAHRHQLEPRL